MWEIAFEKAKGRGGTVNRTNDYVEAAVRRGSIKQVLWETSQKKTPVPESLFIKIWTFHLAT